MQTGEEFLDVEVAIIQEGKKKPVEIRKYGYPIETSEKEIKDDIKKCVAEFKRSRAQAEAQAKVDATETKANKIINNLEGTTIS